MASEDQRQRGHEDDAAADTEETRDHAGDDAERRDRDDARQKSASLIPTQPSSTADVNGRQDQRGLNLSLMQRSRNQLGSGVRVSRRCLRLSL